MTQLARFFSGHFASHHSPTRERREAGFAKTGKSDKGKGKERAEHGEGRQQGQSKEISAQRDVTASKMAEVAPEMLDAMQEILESRDARAGNELAADVLKDPERGLKVLHAIDGRIRQYEELRRIAEKRSNAVLTSHGLYALQVAPLLNPPERDEDDRGGSDIDTLTDETLRTGIWIARDARRKMRNMEALAGHGPGQGQEYLSSLKQHSVTLREHLHLQLQARIKRMVEKCESAGSKVGYATAGKDGTKRAYFLSMVENLRLLQKDIDDIDSRQQMFADSAENYLNLLMEAEQELEMYDRGDFDSLNIDKTFRERKEWVSERKGRVETMLQRTGLKDVDRDFLEKLEQRLNGVSQTMPAITERERKRIDIALASMDHQGPDALQRAEAEANATLSNQPVTSAWCSETETALSTLSTSLIKLLGSDEGRTPKVTAATQQKLEKLQDRLGIVSNVIGDAKSDPGSESLRTERASIEKELSKLKACADDLQPIRQAGVVEIPDEDEFRKSCDDAAGTSIACYQPRKERMYASKTQLDKLDPDARARKLVEIREHEFNHATTHILEKTKVFPNLTFDEFSWMFPDKADGTPDAKREEWEQLLFAAGEEWGINKRLRVAGVVRAESLKQATAKEKKAIMHPVMGELAQEFKGWESGKSYKSDTEKRLHELYAAEQGKNPYHRVALHMTADDQATMDGQEDAAARTGGTPAATPVAAAEQGEKTDPVAELKEVQKKVKEIEEFGREHPEYGGEIHDILDGNGRLRQRMADLQHMIEHPTGIPPEQILNDLGIIAAEVDDIHSHMVDMRAKLIDPTYAQPTEPASFWSRLHLLSLSDVAKICSDLKEDWLAESKRAQERKTSEVEEELTSAIPDDLPFPWGKYTSRLKHYARRRKTSTEQEASKKWEDALQLRDPHDLLEMLGRSPTKDQLKAIITLLCHKGHMDWNDKNFIRAIEIESGYKIPAEAMKKDVDRDKWLRKIITAIWPDEKEFYDHSRVENDGAFESAKGKYTTMVDDISNIRGEMGRQLQEMLTIWEENHGHPPVEISPHKYEELIHFAMRDGKMTMEQKFYYLIRGAAAGLLPVQRVRALAGEKAGLLNKFPFIDYFSGNDNTLPALKKRAMELTERDYGGNDTFKPGAKTTMWLHRVVAQDPAVRTRVLKGADRIAEQMDHEDIPFFITALGVNVGTLASVISGSRQKVTKLGWKNAYCGYSSKFKIFGMIAKLERDGKPGAHIKNEDIQALAQNFGGYIFMDNALTRSVCNNFADGGPPKLAEAEYNGLPAPSAIPGKNTRAYQTRLNHLVREVIGKDSIRSALIADATWVAKCREHGFNDPLDTLNKFAPLNPNDPWARNTEKQAVDLAKLNDTFMTVLEKAITKNTDTQSDFKDALINNAEVLLNEGGSTDLTIDFVEANLRAEAQAVGGDGHGGGH